ncbi:MAG TPA: hypothetical protein VFC24_08120 [Casimicrobiaceae bacterium]|nr:hypothetical protein [Casimicrobiaceae bacterium]
MSPSQDDDAGLSPFGDETDKNTGISLFSREMSRRDAVIGHGRVAL